MHCLARFTILLALGVAAWAQDPPASAPPASPAPPPASPSDVQITLELQRLHQELTALRAQVDKLQSTLDIYVNGMVAELQDENTRLRRQLRRAYGENVDSEILAIPTPDRDVLEDALINPLPAALTPAEEPPASPPAKFTHQIITEWGRSIEEAQQLGDKVQSLKGLIVSVPSGSTDDQLRGLARTLRAEYAAYDNINIEVFLGEEPARAYAGGNAAAAEHRVLSISKHAASGRDTAILIRPDRTEMIALSES